MWEEAREVSAEQGKSAPRSATWRDQIRGVVSGYLEMLKWAVPFAVVVVVASGFMQSSPGVPLGATGPVWQTVVIHLVGFGAALRVLRLVSGWTTQAGGAAQDGPSKLLPHAVGATVVAYGVVDAAQLAFGSVVDYGTPTVVAPDAQFAYAVKHLLTTGLYEEATFAAIPAAAAELAIALCARRRPVGRLTRIGIRVSGIVVGGVLRGVLHFYQGPTAAGVAVVWGAAAVLIYLRWRSIAGLVVVHGWYNSVVLLDRAGPAWLGWYAVASWILLIIGAAVALAYGHTVQRHVR